MRQRLHPLLLHLSCNSGFLHIFTSSQRITSNYFVLVHITSAIVFGSMDDGGSETNAKLGYLPFGSQEGI
jgi:hypothetical protein